MHLSTKTLLHLLIYFVNISYVFSYVLNPDVGTRRLFGGIGAISGGGATSKLLRNYPLKQRSEILDYLFKPNFGANLQILKVEIGGDSQSTDGVESSHMHTCDDENYDRGYEWWLMKQAKKINPSIKLYGLPWVFPGWLADPSPCPVQSSRPAPTKLLVQDNPFHNISALIDYTTKWVRGAKVHHGLDINYLGIWNERLYNVEYIIRLREALDSMGFSKTRIVAPEMQPWWYILNDFKKYPKLASAIDILGMHYPGTETPVEALIYDLDIWCSEEYSKWSSVIEAPGCWARILNEGFVNGHYTGFIAWNLITSYYENFPYSHSGLMMANQPWSGHYEVGNTIWMTAHMTQFVDIGWRYLGHGHGSGFLDGNGTYVTLTNDKHYTIIVQTLDSRQAKCFYGMPEFHVVQQQLVKLDFKGKMANIKKLYVWASKLDFEDVEASYTMKRMSSVDVVNGSFSFSMQKSAVITFTTDPNRGNKGTFDGPIPASSQFILPYKDDFNSYPAQAEPYDFSAQSGVFEIRHIGYMTQTLDRPPIDTCRPLPMTHPIALIGRRWVDVNFNIDIFLEPSTPANHGVIVAARIPSGGCDLMKYSGVFVLFSKHKITVFGDYLLKVILFEKNIIFIPDIWYSVNLNIKNNLLKVSLDSYEILRLPLNNMHRRNATLTVPNQGFIGIGTSAFFPANFDNFMIHPI